MKRLRKKENRMWISFVAGLFAVMLTVNIPLSQQRSMMAWWGSLYPRFCFVREVEENDVRAGEEGQEHRRKISFWLAKAFDRW